MKVQIIFYSDADEQYYGVRPVSGNLVFCHESVKGRNKLVNLLKDLMTDTVNSWIESVTTSDKHVTKIINKELRKPRFETWIGEKMKELKFLEDGFDGTSTKA